MLVGRVLGLWAGGTRCGAGFRGEGGGASEVRARTATGDDDNFGTTPFFLAVKTIVLLLINIIHNQNNSHTI